MAIRIWWQSSTPITQPHMADYRNALTAHLEAVRRPDVEVHIMILLGDLKPSVPDLAAYVDFSLAEKAARR